MENKNLFGMFIVAILAVGLVGLIWTSRAPSPPGAAVVAPMASGGGHNNEGFSSYEEMMRAHHPEQAASAQAGASEDGCGGVSTTPGKQAAFYGTASTYDVTYDNAGYEKLLALEKTITLNAEQNKKIVGLDITIPCCGVRTLQAAGNCECGHHMAMFGLAKLLATKNFSREQIQAELDKWKIVFYPDGSGSNTGGC